VRQESRMKGQLDPGGATSQQVLASDVYRQGPFIYL
jgi:hypothetical protein